MKPAPWRSGSGERGQGEPAPRFTLALAFSLFSLGLRLGLSGGAKGQPAGIIFSGRPRGVLGSDKRMLMEPSPTLETVTKYWGSRVSLFWFNVCIRFLMLL